MFTVKYLSYTYKYTPVQTQLHGSCPDVKIKFKDFSRTFKDHMKAIQGELH